MKKKRKKGLKRQGKVVQRIQNGKEQRKKDTEGKGDRDIHEQGLPYIP